MTHRDKVDIIAALLLDKLLKDPDPEIPISTHQRVAVYNAHILLNGVEKFTLRESDEFMFGGER
jgi:hypothetical protein